MIDRVDAKYFPRKRIDGAGNPTRKGWVVYGGKKNEGKLS
jgi:hypothetical protein